MLVEPEVEAVKLIPVNHDGDPTTSAQLSLGRNHRFADVEGRSLKGARPQGEPLRGVFSYTAQMSLCLDRPFPGNVHSVDVREAVHSGASGWANPLTWGTNCTL